MDLRQTVENAIATFYKSVDELKTNPVVMDINQYGSQAFFAVYKGALDLIRLLIPLASPDAHVEGEGDAGAE
uniref:Uncharacterized protein n=1 Tax=Megaselia scalaris TaxID=36166 RepID=T1GUB0_MEGSC